MPETSDQLLERLTSLHPRLIDLKLDRMERLLAALGDPHKKLPPVIHVAGTNGKGSTIALMRAMLEAQGLSIHTYTSPHLVSVHERIRLGRKGGGVLATDAVLRDALNRCEQANQGLPITIFEILTTAALLIFSEHPADLLLLEVGLGGRFDATNVIEKPVLSVITPISIDHTDFLGNDLAMIASEKAGIIKTSVPVVSACQQSPVIEPVLEKEALRHKARLYRFGQDYHVQAEDGRLLFQDENGMLDLPLPRLTGAHQIINAGTAICALRVAGYGLNDPALFELGLQRVDWPARLQHLGRGRLAALLPKACELWLDGGHNLEGAQALASALQAMNHQTKRPLVLIAGLLSSKDSQGFLNQFSALAPTLYAVPIPDHAASRKAEEVADQAQKAGYTATTATSVQDALQSIAARPDYAQARVVICGSLYLAGSVLRNNGTEPD